MTMTKANALLVHVSSTESRQIHAFRLDAASGDLELIEVLEVPGSGAPRRGNIPMTWSRDGRHLYAQVRTAPFPLTTFALDPASGRLQAVSTIDMPAPIAYLSQSLDGRLLLGASYDGALLTVNRVDSQGLIEVPCLQTVETPPKAHCIVEAPFGRQVYASSVDGDVILRYVLNPVTGRLEPASAPAARTRSGDGPRHLVFHPTLDVLYCINEHSGTLASFRASRTTGALEPLETLPLMPSGFSGNALASDIHLTPDGCFLYASVRTTHSIIAFRVDAVTGELTPAGSFEAEPNPRGFAIEQGGRFLLCAGQESDRVGVFRIDPASGALLRTGSHAVGKRPSWIEIRP